MTTDPKGEMGADALKEFLGQFGKPDIYTQTFLEVLFEELIYDSYEEVETNGNNETLSVPRETGQNGDQNGLPSTRTKDNG